MAAMRIEKHHKIGFFDTDHQLKLRIQSVARFFQEIAVFHSTRVGVGPDVLSKKGVGWFLNRLEIEFFRYPMLGENIKIITWSRGFKRYKAYREYLIESPQGEIARGSSIWIFFDFNRKRIAKVPVQISGLYEVDKEKYFDKEIDDWKTCGRIHPEKQMDISLRYSDFDVNGHVNNTIYLEFLETLYHKTINSKANPIRNIKIRFNREIGKVRESIRTGWFKANGVYQCNIFDDSILYADAQIVPQSI
jgi:acyl-ACP thioesterase